MGRGDPIETFDDVGAAYGLTARQTELLTTLIEQGGVHEAATQLGIPYTSARNMVVALKDKFGVPTVPMLIGLVLDLKAAGREPPLRHDLFSLTDRQFAIAHDLGTLKSREEIASRLNISSSVVDAELKQIYLVLGVQGAGQVAGIVASAGLHVPGVAIEAFERDTAHTIPTGTLRSGERRIGYSDYGPEGGKPVLILHSAITSRAPPTRLVAELRDHGYRPVTIDRPGYGDSDPGPAREDPYVQASRDIAAVCEALDLGPVQVIARGPGMATMRLHTLYPRLVSRAVLVNPTPAYAYTSRARGPLGAVKRAYARRPWAIGTLLGLLARRQTPASFYSGMVRSFRDSPPDEALARDDPQFVADYLRAVRGFQQGRTAGYLVEQTAWISGYDVAAIPGLGDWRIVQGAVSMLRDPEEALQYWRAKLPDTPIRWVADAGQMLAYSHPHLVVDELA